MSEEKPLSDGALVAIGQNQATNTLFVSPITAWEIALASRKYSNPMKLGQFTPDEWFRAALALTGSRIAPIHQKIAIETARVAALTGHSDPADCCLMATARIKEVPLITHDPKIRAAAAKGYLQVIVT